MKNDQCDRVARGRLLLVFTFVCAQGRRARVFPYAEDHIRMSGCTHGVHTYTIKESELMKPLLKQTTWLRLRRGENQVRTPWVMKSCVNARQGCVFFFFKSGSKERSASSGEGASSPAFAARYLVSVLWLSWRAERVFASGRHTFCLLEAAISSASAEELAAFYSEKKKLWARMRNSTFQLVKHFNGVWIKANPLLCATTLSYTSSGESKGFFLRLPAIKYLAIKSAGKTKRRPRVICFIIIIVLSEGELSPVNSHHFAAAEGVEAKSGMNQQ